MSGAPKIYQVMVRSSAKMMMLEHIAFLSLASISAAERMFGEFEKAFASLSRFPHRCPVYETPYAAAQYRRLLVDRYALLFTVDEYTDTVSIEYIWDTRQNIRLL